MKYSLFFCFLLVGCSPPLREGHCYFVNNYSVALKVTKALKYGAFLTAITRPNSANLNSGVESKHTDYLSYETIKSQYFSDFASDCGLSAIEVDCEAYDKIDKTKVEGK